MIILFIKSIIFLIDQNGDSIDYQPSYNGDTTLITIEPEVLLTELGTLSVNINQARFCDNDTNLVSSSYQFIYNIADVSPPSFSEYSFGRGNDYILLELKDTPNTSYSNYYGIENSAFKKTYK